MISGVRNITERSAGMPPLPKRPRMVCGRRNSTKSATAPVSSPTRVAAQLPVMVVPAGTAAFVNSPTTMLSGPYSSRAISTGGRNCFCDSVMHLHHLRKAQCRAAASAAP